MPSRVVNLGTIAFVDESGLHRYGTAGETVEVHPDNLERFDSLNGEQAEEKKPARKSASSK